MGRAMDVSILYRQITEMYITFVLFGSKRNLILFAQDEYSLKRRPSWWVAFVMVVAAAGLFMSSAYVHLDESGISISKIALIMMANNIGDARDPRGIALRTGKVEMS
jgi:hypothetical protein